MDSKYRSRKFSLAVAFSLTGMVALFTGHISEGSFLGLVGLVLGLYSAANVADKKVQK